MNDDELAKFLGIDDCDPEKVAKYLSSMDPKRRAGYERMARVCDELTLWQAGVGPKPECVIVCAPRKGHRHDD